MDEMSAANAPGPYALLHLRAGAPRELVEETYWLLVRRLRFGLTDDVEGLRRVDQLNAAYEAIARNGMQRQSRQPTTRTQAGAPDGGAGSNAAKRSCWILSKRCS